MPARVRKIRHDEETRKKIQTSQLLNRLHDHIFGNVDISQTQMKAIEILLKKTLPDLSAIQISTDDSDAPEQMSDNELVHTLNTVRSLIASQGREEAGSDLATAPAPNSSKH